MKVLAKRTVEAGSGQEAVTIALASIRGADKHLVQVQCTSQGVGSYRCMAGYKTRKQLAHDAKTV